MCPRRFTKQQYQSRIGWRPYGFARLRDGRPTALRPPNVQFVLPPRRALPVSSAGIGKQLARLFEVMAFSNASSLIHEASSLSSYSLDNSFCQRVRLFGPERLASIWSTARWFVRPPSISALSPINFLSFPQSSDFLTQYDATIGHAPAISLKARSSGPGLSVTQCYTAVLSA